MFIINGDFSLALTYIGELNKLVSMITDNGGLNLDGILRFWIKVPIVAFYYIFQNQIATSYFYIAYVYVLLGFSIYTFFRYFFPKYRYISLPILFFLLNPIFLGNLSKIGLVLGAGMLPLLLVFIHKYFMGGKTRYLYIAVLCLTFALIHPFTLIVNTGVGLLFFIYLFLQNKGLKVGKILGDITLVSIFSILFFSFLILPILTAATSLNKTELADDISKEVAISGTYSQGIYTFHTQGILNNYTLSKPILKDYEFYDDTYELFYIVSTLTFLLIILSSGLFTKGKASKRLMGGLIGFFLLLIALSSGKFGFVNDTMAWVVDSFPGGWAFRSPLKWQLYMPMLLSILLLLSLQGFFQKKTVTIVVLFCIVIMNGYLLKDIVQKLIIPKQFEYLGSYGSVFQNSKVLFLKNKPSSEYTRNDTKFLEGFAILTKSYSIRPTEIGLSKEYNSNVLTAITKYDFDYIITQIIDSNVIASDRYIQNTEFDNGYVLYKSKKISTNIFLKESNVKYKFSTGSFIGIDIPNNFRIKGWSIILDKESIRSPYIDIFQKENLTTDEVKEFVNISYSQELTQEGYPRTLGDGRMDYKYYIQNPDGSIDVELTLYFRPQLYFYIGLIISGTTLAILIISLVVISLRERRTRRESGPSTHEII